VPDPETGRTAVIRPPEEVGDVTNTMWTLAPAGARGPVGLALRAAARRVEAPAVVRPRAVAVTPVGAPRTDAFGAPRTDAFGAPRPDAFGIALIGTPAIDAFGTTGYPQVSKRTNTQHDGTTLGNPSSRRPPPS
jgi:hypothetical protein